MGYTHTYRQTRNLDDAEWAAITRDAQSIFECSPVKLANGISEPGSAPEIGKLRNGQTAIWFNGVEGEDYETFLLSKTVAAPLYPGGESGYNFTKTGFSEVKPYDFIVKAVLIVAANIAPDAFEIESDGWDFEWMDALAFVDEVCGGASKYSLPPAVANNAGFYMEYYEAARREFMEQKGIKE